MTRPARDTPPADPRSDAELVTAANRGDPRAFEVLYERYRGWVIDLARRLTGDEHLAADILQDAFVWLAGRFPGFELRARMTSVLYPVVRHAAISARQRDRRRAPGPAPPATGIVPPDDPASAERLAVLARALEALPPGQRETLILRFADGLSLAEIASALGLPLGTVKSRLHLALAALRDDPRTASYFDE